MSVDLSKYAWMAQRSGRKGAESLAVLQDALQERYGKQLHGAQRKAKRKSRRYGRTYVVIFAPTMHRAYEKHTDTRGWYDEHHWPFSVTSTNGIFRLRSTAVAVWETSRGYDVHDLAEIRKQPRASGDRSRRRRRR